MSGDPLDFLDRAQLVDLAKRQSEQAVALRKLWIDSGSADVERAGVEMPALLVADHDQTNVRDLVDEYQRRQVNFDTAPFDPDGHKFRMFPGGVTIWSGYPGTGKTTLLRQLVCHLLHHQRGVFLASLEERPSDTLVRLMMTASGTPEPSLHACQWFLDAHGDRLRMWAMVGLARFSAVLAAARWSLREEQIRHVLIDSLTCLDIGGSDWDGQRGLANELAALARSMQIHVHLVAHPRKPGTNDNFPDVADIAGSSDLGRLADNVVFMQRNLDLESSHFGDATPMKIIIRKQRHGTGMCGDIVGWFHRSHRQFSTSQFWCGPTRYLPDHAYEETS